MDKKTFNDLVDELRADQDELLESKGNDYTRNNPDRLHNFKKVAGELGLTPMHVWAVYISKQWDAIMSYVKTGKVESESLKSRFVDLQNFAYLGYALHVEAAGEATSEGVDEDKFFPRSSDELPPRGC